MPLRERIGEILIRLHVMTPAEVEQVLSAMRRRGDAIKFGQLAREMGLVKEEHILAALAVQMEVVPFDMQKNMRRVLGDLTKPAPKSPVPLKLSPLHR